jgi:hypothetical protein
VSWSFGRNDYHGRVTVFLAFEGEAVVWDHHLTIHWVDERCGAPSQPRGRCRVHTTRG